MREPLSPAQVHQQYQEMVGAFRKLIPDPALRMTFKCWETADSVTPSFFDRERTQCLRSNNKQNILSLIGSPNAFISSSSSMVRSFSLSIGFIISRPFI